MPYESFSQCLKRCLQEGGISASEAARLVEFKSRNSIFRILSGEASGEVKLRFLEKLHQKIGGAWPEQRWQQLEESLSVERLGVERYRTTQAIQRLMHERERPIPQYMLTPMENQQSGQGRLLSEVLEEIVRSAKVEIVITGCYDADLSRLIVDKCNEAGMKGTLSVRHYIDTAKDTVGQNILGILPMVSKPWYNARLVAPGSCPPEMMDIYRLNAIHIHQWDEAGNVYFRLYIRYDGLHFTDSFQLPGNAPAVAVLDKWRFHLELLKPLPCINEGPGVFVGYTEQYLALEEGSTILSIKPDVHFNCIPAELLEGAVMEGFEKSGLSAGEELLALIRALKAVHQRRYDNIMNKHKPTHLVYSLPMMERFMRTGVLSDQFFLQRPYSVEERRQIIRTLLDAMLRSPWFNVHFMKPGAPELQYEISYYDGKGVMLTDAYTGYDLDQEHSEALITLPAFMEGFRQYFQEELLAHSVISRADTIRALERLLTLNISE